MEKQELLNNINKVHTTALGEQRIKNNLNLNIKNVVSFCKNKIKNKDCIVYKKGKNYYAHTSGYILTINSFSFTIITARRDKIMELITDRLILNSFKMEDKQDVARICSNPIFSKNIPNMPEPYTIEQAESFLTMAIEKFNSKTEYPFAIRLKENNQLIGNIHLMCKFKANRAEIGCWLDENYWGKGIMTEAAIKIIDFAFNTLKLHKLIWSALSFNKGSCGVALKLGFIKECEQKEHEFVKGKYADSYSFGLINPNDKNVEKW